jgi:glyoxylase-like metal-dependent hydrolase (beta-lactamase superfamily II)
VIVRTLTVGPLEENAYLIVDDTTRRAVLIDPGEEPARLLAAVRDDRGELDAIWLTHAHMDHVGGIAGIVREVPVPIYLHPRERPIYDSAAQHAMVFGLRIDQPPPPDRELADGDMLYVGTLKFSVIHVPGHAPGHVAIHGNGVAFVGDCLFAGSVGRTDLPLADGAQLERSLDRLCTLPDETIVYPGHGPATSIGREKRTNPFLTGTVRLTGFDR